MTLERWLDSADRVLIAAGAGLSAAAGYDYADGARFAELFPALHRKGLWNRYQLIGLPLPPRLLWGYLSVHVDDIRFGAAPNPVYARLREWLGDGVLVIEIGAGYSTPGVVRWPVESLVRGLPGARLVRINRDHAEVPADLEGRALAVRADAAEVLA